jgi:glycosyltransferase involved in cell wall biosynthesis
MKYQENILSVVMPAYNEDKTIAEVIGQVQKIPHLLELIVIDDCSTDTTKQIVEDLADKDPRILYFRQPSNGGKTSALNKGFSLSQGEIVIVQDADLEYDPLEISSIIEPIISKRADVVYGSRFLVKKATRVLYFYHYLANKCLTFFSNSLTNLNMTDVETCYKAFRGEIIRSMVIESKGFGFEVEVTAKVAKLHCAVYEVPISYYGRTYEQGKKIGTKDGLAALWYIVKYNLFCSLKQSFKVLPQIDGSRSTKTLEFDN